MLGDFKGYDVDTAPLHGRRLRKVRSTFGTVDPTDVPRPQRTAAGTIATPLEQRGIDGPQRRATAAELLDLIDLSTGGARRPVELTEQERSVALAAALAACPSALLVDDPTAGLGADQSGGVLGRA